MIQELHAFVELLKSQLSHTVHLLDNEHILSHGSYLLCLVSVNVHYVESLFCGWLSREKTGISTSNIL